MLPPTIGVNKPNKVLCDPASPLYVNTDNRPWLVGNGHIPRRAGVSSFGFGGTNFHAVLEEYTGGYHDGFRIDLNPRPCEIFYWRRTSRKEINEAVQQFRAAVSDLALCDLAELAAALLHDEMQRSTGRRPRNRVADWRLWRSRLPTSPKNLRLQFGRLPLPPKSQTRRLGYITARPNPFVLMRCASCFPARGRSRRTCCAIWCWPILRCTRCSSRPIRKFKESCRNHSGVYLPATGF